MITKDCKGFLGVVWITSSLFLDKGKKGLVSALFRNTSVWIQRSVLVLIFGTVGFSRIPSDRAVVTEGM